MRYVYLSWLWLGGFCTTHMTKLWPLYLGSNNNPIGRPTTEVTSRGWEWDGEGQQFVVVCYTVNSNCIITAIQLSFRCYYWKSLNNMVYEYRARSLPRFVHSRGLIRRVAAAEGGGEGKVSFPVQMCSSCRLNWLLFNLSVENAAINSSSPPGGFDILPGMWIWFWHAKYTKWCYCFSPEI